MMRASVVTVLGLLTVACGGGDQDEAPAAQIVDTTNADALDGLSSQEVQSKAEALTPEQAAARGIAVDSSIHVENLSGQDTAGRARDSAPAVAAPPAKGDTAAP